MKKLAVLSFAFVLLAGAASAQESHRPPRTVLKQGALRQTGKLGSYCWSWSTGPGEGGGQCVDTFSHQWPRSKEATKGAPARITIKYPDFPDQASLTYWRRVDTEKQPLGEGTDIPYTTSSRMVDGEAVWDLSFQLPDYRGQFFLDGFFAWEGVGDGFYDWRLSLR